MHEESRMFEEPHSSRFHETIARLLLPELRGWYQRAGADRDLAAVGLRNHLSRLAGAKLEHRTDIPDNPD